LTAAKAKRVKDPQTQDFGLTLLVVLGPPSVAALAKVVSDWLQSRSGARLKLSRKDGKGHAQEIEVRGRVGKDQRQIIEDFLNDD
jgi:Effector Associated Constant Component 1